MKYIFRSKETWELLHSWRTGSLEVMAAFFFHYRGSAVQKSFEGILRSLIIQILSPHRTAYDDQYKPIWEKYKSLKKQQKQMASNYEACKEELSGTRAEVNDLEEHRRQYQDPESESRLRQFKQRERYLESQLKWIGQQLQKLVDAIASLAVDFEQHRTNPLVMLLTAMVSDMSETGHGYIPKLEKLLRRLLQQEVIQMDLVLFFDALDEFNGNLDLISRFLKDLVHPQAKSTTRVKVLFSSRPWKKLKEHFSDYPGFALQDHTKSDIESYAAGKVANSGVSGHSLVQVLPFVIAKADGVFLWVRLALNILIEQASSHRGQIPADALKEKLLALPADLFKFYELIIERISKSSRRRTYALLELLIRHNGPPLTTVQIRDAVLVSGCSTYEEARRVLEASSHRPPLSGTETYLERVNSDIYSWGGGLVEIKNDDPSKATENNLVSRPQLMHQTVIEFATGLSFKKTVVGDLTYIISENGHSFHLKYWSTQTQWAKNNKHLAILTLRNWLQTRTSSVPNGTAQRDLGYLNYHAKQSELTTGRSHFDFLFSMPLLINDDEDTHPNNFRNRSHESEFVFLVSSCCLSLCLRDWIASKPGELEKLVMPKNTGVFDTPTFISYPLLTCLVFAPPPGSSHIENLTIIKLLLENGYKLEKEPLFFRWLMEETWRGKLQGHTELIPDESLYKIIRLALEYGASPRDRFVNTCRGDVDAPLIHIAPPQLVEDLIRHGANPNALDYGEHTALDWAIQLPRGITARPRDWDLKRSYDACNLLLRHGGTCNWGATKFTCREVNGLLEKFKREGYDVEYLTARLSEMPGLAGLREYGTLGMQFGMYETHPHARERESQLKDCSSENRLSTAAQARLRAYTARIPLLGSLTRSIGNRFSESPSAVPTEGAKVRDQSPLQHHAAEAPRVPRSSAVHGRSGDRVYHHHAGHTVETPIGELQTRLKSTLDHGTDETVQILPGAPQKKSRRSRVGRMFRL